MSTLQICNGDTTVLALVGGVLVDFGDFPVNEDTTASATVNVAYLPNAYLIAVPVEGADHTADEIAAENVTATIGNVVYGVSFDIVLSAPNGASGKFYVNWG